MSGNGGEGGWDAVPIGALRNQCILREAHVCDIHGATSPGMPLRAVSCFEGRIEACLVSLFQSVTESLKWKLMQEDEIREG